MPADANDERLQEREFQLIRDKWLHPTPTVTTKSEELNCVEIIKIPDGSVLFQDNYLITLWDVAIENDPSFVKIYKVFLRG